MAAIPSQLLRLIIFTMMMVTNPLSALTNKTDNNSSLDLIIDDIHCRQNERTQCSFITKKYYQSIGERVNPEEIADARLRLGTLQQFRNVRVILEKAQQRGHVIVVFIVDEADQTQFNIATHFSSSERIFQSTEQPFTLENNNLSLSFGITDFNFLGSGKQLSANIGTGYARSSSNLPDTSLSPEGSSDIVYYQDNDSRFESHSVGIAYYDPHLFDSVRYYLKANINHLKSKVSNDSYFIDIDGEKNSTNQSQTNYASYALSLGKRFASHSYLEVGYHETKTTKQQVNLIYGWDSTDDRIFPTQGNTFVAQLNGLNQGKFKSENQYLDIPRSLTLGYQNHIPLNQNKVFSYSVYDSYVEKTDNSPISDRFNPHLSLQLSDIDINNSRQGKYAGWKYSLGLPVRGTSSEDIVLGASYIYQTDKLILSFSLSYQKNWGELF